MANINQRRPNNQTISINSMIEVYIGLGSNLQQPEQQIRKARGIIAEHPLIVEKGFSALYQSPPMGHLDQPDYINAVMKIATSISAIDLLRVLQTIENKQGRIRKEKLWESRTLDLDLLLYADQQIDHPDLKIPHKGLAERAFVLYPLQEIAPKGLYIPQQGLLEQLVENCALNGLKPLA